mgnify:CR=1 FL=1
MPKSQIIIDVVNDEAPIEKSLRRLQVLAHDVHNQELEMWAQRELTGYAPEDDLPDYRKATSLNLTYVGLNGSLQVKGVALPLSCLKNGTLDSVSKVDLREDLPSIVKLAESDPGGYRDLTILANEVFNQSGGQIQCLKINQLIPSAHYRKVLAEVKNRIVNALLLLEDQYGKLDKLSFQVTPAKASGTNKKINEALELPIPTVDCTPMHSKITWNVITPIATGAIGAIIATLVSRLAG